MSIKKFLSKYICQYVCKKPILAQHIKTGNLYEVIDTGVDTTNSRDGTNVVIYKKVEDYTQIYVREMSEFMKKFTLTSEAKN